MEKNSGGVGILSLFLVLFVGLKLSGIISWSWWFVFSPVWFPIVIIFAGFLIYLIARGLLKALGR